MDVATLKQSKHSMSNLIQFNDKIFMLNNGTSVYQIRDTGIWYKYFNKPNLIAQWLKLEIS